jgi:hypothetical protein
MFSDCCAVEKMGAVVVGATSDAAHLVPELLKFWSEHRAFAQTQQDVLCLGNVIATCTDNATPSRQPLHSSQTHKLYSIKRVNICGMQ